MSRPAAVDEQRRMIGDPRDFGRVAVMLGGSSSERDVSLQTGRAVLAALAARQVDALAWDPAERGIAEFADRDSQPGRLLIQKRTGTGGTGAAHREIFDHGGHARGGFPE